MKKNKITWIETEYTERPDETIQPVLINNLIVKYVLLDPHGYNYVFTTILAIHLHWSGVSGMYDFTSDREEDVINFLENL